MKADLVHLAGNLEGALARAELARDNGVPSRQRHARTEANEYLRRFTTAALRRIDAVCEPEIDAPPATPRSRNGGAPAGPTTLAPAVPAPGAREPTDAARERGPFA